MKRIPPWVIALGLLGYLFYTIPLDELQAALLGTSLLGLLPLVVLVDVGCWITDSWATSRVLTWFLTPMSLAELLPARATTYLMAILNYNLGQAGLIYYVHRTRRVPLLPTTGLFLMMMGTTVLWLCLLSVGGVLLSEDELVRKLSILLAVLGSGVAVYFVVIWLRPAWLVRHALLRPLFDAGVKGHLGALVVRTPHLAVLMATHFLALRCYGIALPLAEGLILLPALFLVASLPLTPFGFGTMQMTAVHFFAPFAPGKSLQSRQAAVLAYSLALPSMALILQALLGLLFIRRVYHLMRKPEGGE